jgi:HK97 family phage major capsid protein
VNTVFYANGRLHRLGTDYDQTVARGDAQALIPEDASREIIKGVTESSIVMRLARRLPNMPRSQRRMPVQSSLATAYFVNGDIGLKKTTKLDWKNKFLDAEEIAVIMPIAKRVLDDADYDIWGEARPQLVEAVGIAFDDAVFFGTGAPAIWPTNLRQAAINAGNRVVLGTGTDLYADIMEDGGLLNKLELDGYDCTGHVAPMTFKSMLRGVRDAEGTPIFRQGMAERTRYSLDGVDIEFPRNGVMDPALAYDICGQWDALVWALRTDLEWTLLKESVIQDNTGAIIYNLSQMEMVALKVLIRVAWQVPNPINRLQETEANRYPFAVLTP